MKRDHDIIYSEHSTFIPTCRFSASGKVLFTNKAFCILINKDEKLIVGKSFLKIIPSKYYKSIDGQMNNLSVARPNVVFECHVVPENAKVVHLELHFQANFDESGTLCDVLVGAHDITRLKNAETRMRHLIETEYVISAISSSFINIRPGQVMAEINSALHLVGEFTGVERASVFSINESMSLTLANEWCADGIRSLSVDRQQLELKTIPIFADKLKCNQVVRACFETTAIDDFEVIKEWLRSKNMQSILLIPMTYNDQLTGILTFESLEGQKKWENEHITRLRTISEIFVNAMARVRAEEEIERHRKLLVQADKLSSLGTLVAGVAHEINNPTSLITMSAPILQEAWNDIMPILEAHFVNVGDFKVAGIDFSEAKSDIDSLCNNIIDGGDRIKNIVLDLKDYSRETERDQHSAVDINNMVTTSVSLTRKTISELTHNLVMNLDENGPILFGNEQRLQQVLINLIVNAGQSLENSNQAVTISTNYNAETGNIEIIVKDEGCGIAQEDMPKIFDPFFTRKGDVGGTGLGLSISHTIIAEHNGTLEFTSELGIGTQAIITLPIA